MEKIDKRIIDAIISERKFDVGLAGILGERESTRALVRVHNPIHMGLLERNFRVVKAYPFIRSVSIECALKDVIKLERMREVEYVSAQGKVFALGDADKGVTSISTLASGSDLDGRGVTLCVLDTGISPHVDLSLPKERIIHFEDMIGEGSVPYDDNGHGTFVAGIAAGDGILSGKKIMGVAPRANVVGVKVIGANGESGAFKILDGMQWLFDNFRQYGIRVVCMSFGADPQGYADPLKLGAEMLSKSGLIVVAASGNSGENNLKSPAISNEIISVGAVNKDDKVANFTSRGVYGGVKRPDLYADGVNVKGIVAGGTYSTMSGTSASAPYVAGACCLLCQKYKNLSPRMAKNMLISACKRVGDNYVLRLS